VADFSQAGSGDTVAPVTLGESAALFTAQHSGSANFAIEAVDANGQMVDLLVNTIGGYQGTTTVNLTSDGVAALKITAEGSWNILVQDLTKATPWDGLAPFQGKGDMVLNVNGVSEGGLVMLNFAHQGEANFAVESYGTEGIGWDLLVNEIGAYQGQNILPNGTVLLGITADGTWSIAKS